MASITLKYVKSYRDKTGKMCHYFRRKGSRNVRLVGEYGSQEFMNSYYSIMANANKPTPPKMPVEGTLDRLIVEYFQSAEFHHLKPITQNNYRGILEKLRSEYGQNELANLNRRTVQLLVDEKVTSKSGARNFLKRFRHLLNFAVEREYLKINPAINIKLPKSQGDGFRAWTQADIEKFLDYWPSGTKERLALFILLYTGQRRSDVVGMGRQNLDEHGRLSVIQQKGRNGVAPTRLLLPLHPVLKSELDLLPSDQLLFLVTAYGRPFSQAGFSKWFSERASMAGLPKNSSPHGLRKSAASNLAEAGATTAEIAAFTGHKSARELEVYTKAASQKALADHALTKLIRTQNEREVSNS